MTPRPRLVVAILALALAGGCLAGCSLIPNPVKEVIENGGGGSDGGGGDGGSGGGSDAGDEPLSSIPASFPAEVPLVEGEVINGLQVSDASWGVAIRVADEAAAREATTLLENAGFTQVIPGVESGYENEHYKVAVFWGPDPDEGYAVSYSVVGI